MMGQDHGMSKTVAKAESIAIQMGAKEVNIHFRIVINEHIYNNSTQGSKKDWAGKHGYEFHGGGHEGSTVIWKKIF